MAYMEFGPAARARRRRGYVLSAIIVFALAVLPIVLVEVQGRRANSTLALLISMITAAGLGTAWNILGGYAGQLSLGHVAFYGLGAYASGLLIEKLGVTSWLGLLVGPLIGGLVALGIGWITFRLRGPYFTLSTIAIAEIIFLLSKTLEPITGGSSGLSWDLNQSRFWPRDPQWLFGPTPGRVPYYWIALAITVIAVIISWKIAHNKLGFYLRAIREDQDTAATIGINNTRMKLTALVISAMLVALIGAFRANFEGAIAPDTVLVRSKSLEIVLFAIIGGMGTVWGPVIGGVLLTLVGEALRGIGEANQLVYGVLLVLVIFFLPGGLLGGAKTLLARLTTRRANQTNQPAALREA